MYEDDTTRDVHAWLLPEDRKEEAKPNRGDAEEEASLCREARRLDYRGLEVSGFQRRVCAQCRWRCRLDMGNAQGRRSLP